MLGAEGKFIIECFTAQRAKPTGYKDEPNGQVSQAA
jgi:hypothetical protein